MTSEQAYIWFFEQNASTQKRIKRAVQILCRSGVPQNQALQILAENNVRRGFHSQPVKVRA